MSARFLVVLFGTLEYDGRVQRMIEILSALGDVTLVDLDRGSGPERTAASGAEGGQRRVRVRPGDGRVLAHARFWRATLREAKRVRPDVVVAEDFFTAFPCWLAATSRRAKLVYDAHELIIPDFGRRKTPRNRFWYRLERWVVRRADLVIAANPERAQLMADHYRLASVPEHMRNIPPRPVASGALRGEVEARYPVLARRHEGDRIVLYQGSVTLARRLGRFVEALAHLPPEYRMVVAGDGPDVAELEALGAKWAAQGRFATLGRVPQTRLPAVTARADVGVVTYPYEGLNNLYCAPNKIFEYAQAGLPVVTTDQSPLRSLVWGHGIGTTIGRDDGPQEIAAALRTVVEEKETYLEALERFTEAHPWERERDRVRRSIEGVLGEGA
jgi:glycosyltransferase involved in cell wall biosynthesis